MKRAIKWTTAITALWLIAAQPVLAGVIQCGVHYIQDSERRASSKYEVLKKCGEPDAKMGNTWIYNQSGGSTREVRFNDAGTISSIR